MYENITIFEHMHSKLAKSAHMTPQKKLFSSELVWGVKKTLNFMLIPNSLSQNVPKKLLPKTKEKFTNSEKI